MVNEKSEVNSSFHDTLKIEGINYKGFGILPKYIMLDNKLTLESKTIYGYFCSYAGNGSSAFPGRDKILNDLQIGKNAYYKHFSLLTSQNYVSITKNHSSNGNFTNNIYTLINKQTNIMDDFTNKRISISDNISFDNVLYHGFGIIPKAVMLDKNLTIKSKGIYCYFSVYATAGNSAFPKKDLILHQLNISENTYYKHLNILCDLNYIKVIQRRIAGKLNVNDYYINDFSGNHNAFDIDNLILKKELSQHKSPNLKKGDMIKGDMIKGDMIKGDMIKGDMIKGDTNINNLNKTNLNINTLNINQSYNQNENTSIEGLSDIEINKIVYSELFETNKIPYWYKKDIVRLSAAIKILSSWDSYYICTTSNKSVKQSLEYKIHNIFNEAIISMCTTDDYLTLNGSKTSYAKVIDKLNDNIEITINKKTNIKESINFNDFMNITLENYRVALMERDIKNHIKYMQSCIWSSLQVGGDINTLAWIERDFGTN